jgi:polysaccharide pyruvyl transferase WcaK-like protein
VRLAPVPPARIRQGLRPLKIRRYYFNRYNSRPFSKRPLTLLPGPHRASGPRLVNVAAFGQNAGDKLLPIMVRDVISRAVDSPVRWDAEHVHQEVDAKSLAMLNRADAVVIGGGGLFLKDTNPNQLSGWQWSCSVDALDAIRSPLAVFAVGYNRFRGQDDFDPVFERHLRRLLDKAMFVGLRNSGSIEAISRYRPPRLAEKVMFQPCPTTLATRLYPDLFDRFDAPRDRPIALNCAFDRASLRFGDNADAVLDQIGEAMRLLAADHPIEYFAHMPADEAMLPVLEAWGVPFTLRRLYKHDPRQILEIYAQPSVVLGMRGHAQMVPFGCGRPIISLASHDKLWYFLRDTGLEDRGIDISSSDLRDRILEMTTDTVNDLPAMESRVGAAQSRMWQLTQTNVARLWRGTRPGHQ